MHTKQKKDILKSVRNYLLDEGFDEIRVNPEDAIKPKKIVEERSGAIYQPDMVASDAGSSHIFQVVKPDNIESYTDEFIKKCNIFERHAASKNGKLYLIVPMQYFDKTIRLINKNNLENIGIVQIGN